jgi:putative inorganic carbon (HCO3(-)) transporter
VRTLVLLAGILDALGMTLVYPYVGYCCGRGSRCSNRTTRGLPEQRWAYDLAIAIQASLFVFCVAGAARSMAYYDLFIIEIALLLPLREIILPERKQKRPK